MVNSNKKQQEKLIKMLKLWLKKNDLNGDTAFCTIEEWKDRGETYHSEADFVVTTEGGLYNMINYGNAEEFYDLTDSFGYICEMGHSWNIGFYYDEEDETQDNIHKTYSQKLKDARWQKKRNFILIRAHNRCEDCWSTDNLEIHHCYYMYGFEPWEYPFDSLRCLCRNCHEKRGLTEQILRGNLASLKTNELNSLIDLITSGLYWYPKEEMFSLLSSFSYDQEKTQEIFSDLLTKKLKQQF
jgi:hypothetical protein